MAMIPGALILIEISNCIHYKVQGEITYLFTSFNGAAVEVWEWMSNFIPHFTGHQPHVITYPRWESVLEKGVPDSKAYGVF